MELYYKYQPVTWYVGVIQAAPDAIAEVLEARYIPNHMLRTASHENGLVDKALLEMEPIGLGWKYLFIKTKDERTILFHNCFGDELALPTWNVACDLGVSAYYVCNIPNTISKDHRSGAYGARVVEYRRAGNTIVEEPTFGVHLINDAGRWCFYRFGEKQPFEDEKAYKSYRKTDRFTEEMLVRYCEALGIPVYDRNFYSDEWILIQGKPQGAEKGLSYAEAAVKFRLKPDLLQRNEV
jgi:hypothetical protein